jgi:NADPH-dependent curcumin reductase CurA
MLDAAMAVTAAINHQIRLASRPVGLPTLTDFAHTEEPVAHPGDGEFLVRVLYISLDPAMRGWLNEGRSYIRPVAIGDVMRAIAVGEVIESKHPTFKEGGHVTGAFGVQEYAISDGAGVTPIDPTVVPLPVYLSALGLPGMTAYFGLLDIGAPQPGQTVVVSAAAGAVGQMVGQVAKIKGCRAVGIAGSAEKCRFVVDDLGFDACIDYKSEDVRARLRELCPDRINVYFDNVGGDILDTALTWLARRARIVICGAISQYNATGPHTGPSHYMALLVDRARMEGFLVFDYADRYMEAAAEMAGWMAAGKLRSREDVAEGIEHFHEALLKLFRGDNIGKLILKTG